MVNETRLEMEKWVSGANNTREGDVEHLLIYSLALKRLYNVVIGPLLRCLEDRVGVVEERCRGLEGVVS